MSRGPPSTRSGAVRARRKDSSYLFSLLSGTRSVRSRDGMRDPNWQIDEGDEEAEWLRTAAHTHQPSASSSLSTVPLSIATSPYFRPQIEEVDDTEEQDHGYFPVPTHGRNASAASDSALLQYERKSHPRSLWDRFVKYTDGLRKSPSYRSGRVRPVRSAHHSALNIDDVPAEAPPPFSRSVLGVAGSSRPGGSSGMAASTSTLPSAPARTHLVDDARDALAHVVEPDEQSVLLISRVPGQDFPIDDATTEHSAPLR
ncbi:hypothetical protein DAEQUDRAFT_529045 [Daedalea quercina L-15889]|uniref:Uncharacterized protein n=1 Tax=Daedalea quercina L-15889 TaxID=1314783 RepID=A0A165M7U2_9APHY|nr:hypothetical protein DAEQUDRAFT_529045 [Daedalea quercina L-15889]